MAPPSRSPMLVGVPLPPSGVSKRGPRQKMRRFVCPGAAPLCLWSVVCVCVFQSLLVSLVTATLGGFPSHAVSWPGLWGGSAGQFSLGLGYEVVVPCQLGPRLDWAGGSFPMWLQRMLACGVSVNGPLCGVATIQRPRWRLAEPLELQSAPLCSVIQTSPDSAWEIGC